MDFFFFYKVQSWAISIKMIFHSLLHNRNPSFPKGRSSPLVRYDIILWNDCQSQWKILHRLTAACQMCQTHHLSMQRHHSTKSAWRHPLKRHTFSGSKWQVEPVRHHMGGSGTRLASPSKRHKLLPHGGVCVTLPRKQWQPTGYLVPVSAGRLTTQEYSWACYCAVTASERQGIPSFAFM